MKDRTGGSLTRKPPCSPRTFRQLVRSLRDRVLESTAPTLAERLYRLSDRIARLPFRREVVILWQSGELAWARWPPARVRSSRRLAIGR